MGTEFRYADVREDEAQTEKLEGIVKWYNPDKGYGFLTSMDGQSEVYISGRAVEYFGRRTPRKGDKVVCIVAQHPRGLQVRKILGVYAQLDPEKAEQFDHEADDVEVVEGIVKWFNPLKGFGFVTLDDGSDIFLHEQVLLKSGLSRIYPGARLLVHVGEVEQGREARKVEVLENAPAAS